VLEKMSSEFLLYLVFGVLCIFVFVACSELAVRLERQRFFDFANSTYIFSVLSAIGSLACGSFCLMKLNHLGEQELMLTFHETTRKGVNE
jgi:hypothetical protein